MTSVETELKKVFILRHDCEAMFGCIGPNDCIIRLATKPNVFGTCSTGKGFLKSRHEPMAKVFVQEKFQAVEPGTVWGL